MLTLLSCITRDRPRVALASQARWPYCSPMRRNQAVVTTFITLLALTSLSLSVSALPGWLWAVAGASFVVAAVLRVMDRGGDPVQP